MRYTTVIAEIEGMIERNMDSFPEGEGNRILGLLDRINDEIEESYDEGHEEGYNEGFDEGHDEYIKEVKNNKKIDPYYQNEFCFNIDNNEFKYLVVGLINNQYNLNHDDYKTLLKLANKGYNN